jgi:hypothetical protein
VIDFSNPDSVINLCVVILVSAIMGILFVRTMNRQENRK